MLKNMAFTIIILVLGLWGSSLNADTSHAPITDEITETKVLNLIESSLASVEDHEVIMTKVEMPAGGLIPKHTHPVEEFFYVIKGSTILRLEDKADQTFEAGSAGKIPAKAPHSAESGPEGMIIMVFRVHKKGEPVRTLVD